MASDSVAAVRHFTRERFDRVTPKCVSDLVLVASELATNAIVHARTRFSVGLGLTGGVGRIDHILSAPELTAPARPTMPAHHGIAFGNIEVTPMIGGNDVQTNIFRLTDITTVASFATQNHLAGVHFWSYDRDIDCSPGPASATCNSIGGAGAHGFLHHFQSAGLK